MPYFKQVEDPENPGQFKYEEVSDDALELDEAALHKRIVGSKAYRDVLEESKKRKEKIRELLEDKPEGDKPATTPPQQQQPAQEQPAPQPVNEDELYAKFVARMQADAEKANKAKKERDDLLTAILVRHSLPDEARPLLENATDPNKMAGDLARSNYRFDNTPGGAPVVSEEDELMAKIFKHTGLDDEK